MMLEQGKFLSGKHRNEAGEELGTFLESFYNKLNISAD